VKWKGKNQRKVPCFNIDSVNIKRKVLIFVNT
jgi:hypothetical protein